MAIILISVITVTMILLSAISVAIILIIVVTVAIKRMPSRNHQYYDIL